MDQENVKAKVDPSDEEKLWVIMEGNIAPVKKPSREKDPLEDWPQKAAKYKIKHFEVISDLKRILSDTSDDFIVVGMVALKAQGFSFGQSLTPDLDIVINDPSKKAKAFLESKMVSPMIDYEGGGTVCYQFMWKGVKVDVFLNTPYIKQPLLDIAGIKFASVMDIVSVKKSWKRPKDIIHLLSLANQIYSGEELSKHIKSQ